MAKNKTTETNASVATYLKSIKDDKRREDFTTIVDLITELTGLPPKMWGTAIVGFGSYHYKYESGREGDAPLTGLASRANAITFYLGDFEKKEDLLTKLGKHKTQGGCVYVQKLEDINISILSKMVKKSFEHQKKLHQG